MIWLFTADRGQVARVPDRAENLAANVRDSFDDYAYRNYYSSYGNDGQVLGARSYITYPIASSKATSSYSSPTLVPVRGSSTSYNYSSGPEYAPPAPEYGNVPAGGCYVSGCSGQICSDSPGAISTCEYREEYACYQSARCERQASGQCGWTPTPALSACLSAID